MKTSHMWQKKHEKLSSFMCMCIHNNNYICVHTYKRWICQYEIPPDIMLVLEYTSTKKGLIKFHFCFHGSDLPGTLFGQQFLATLLKANS